MGKADTERYDIEWVMSSEMGRRFIWRVLSFCGVYQDIDPVDTSLALKQLGRRQVGLYLLGICSENSQDKVFTMMQEAHNASVTQELKDGKESRHDDNDGHDGHDDFDYGGYEYDGKYGPFL